jgi:hypothetical protein
MSSQSQPRALGPFCQTNFVRHLAPFHAAWMSTSGTSDCWSPREAWRAALMNTPTYPHVVPTPRLDRRRWPLCTARHPGPAIT